MLKNNKNLFIQKPSINNNRNIYWVVGLLILNGKFKLSNVRKKLKKNNIQTREFFYPMNKQKILSKFIVNKKEKFPNSEFLSKNGFYLPSYFMLKNQDIKYICKVLNKIIS